MNKLFSIIACCLLITGLMSVSAALVETESEGLNVLIFTKTAGYRHGSIPEGIKGFRNLADQEMWNMTATEDASFFNTTYLSKVDVVVFFNTTGDILNAAQETAFEAYIRNGGGFVGVHAAADTEYDWPFYKELIGAHFVGHPPTQEARLEVRHDCHHPAINHLQKEWVLTDEWYYFKEPLKPHATVMMELDEGSITGMPPTGQPHPIAWYHQKFGGRAMYTGIGHTSEQFSDPVYIEHITRSIQWAAGEYEIDQPKEWSNLLDENLSQWDKWMGVPHESVDLPFDFPKRTDVREGKPLGFNNDPLDVFTVKKDKNGAPVLYITGEIYGGLTSKVSYQNYHFKCDFKWGEKKWEPRLDKQRDNGLLFHCTGAHGAFWKVWMRSLECQVQERDFGDFYPLAGTIADFPVRNNPSGEWGHLYDPDGVVVSASFLPRFNAGRIVRSKNYEKPNGEWNTVEIMTIGNKAVFMVNGHMVTALTNARYQEGDLEIPLRGGKIQIQSEAAEAYYKNIQIKGIDAFPAEIVKAAGW